jgi:two-component system sensor histidine kinase/response regulator
VQHQSAQYDNRSLAPPDPTSRRAEALFRQHQQEIFRNKDRLFAYLMASQWLLGIVISLWISPRSWSGQSSQTHLHVWAALLLGGAISLFPLWLAIMHSGQTLTRYAIAVGQMLMGALLIHLTGGRIETHFHVFGSLAFLACYRDWRVLVPAAMVVILDHFIRGVYWPYSVFGELSASHWRVAEHAGWVIFECIFLVISCARSVREMRFIAQYTAQLEVTNQIIEDKVIERTAELKSSESRFRKIFEDGPLGMAVVGLDYRFVQANARLCQMVGYTEQEFTALTFPAITHPEDLDTDIHLAQQLSLGSIPSYTLEKRYIKKNGEILWVTLTASIIRDEDGKSQYYLVMVEDITER